MLLALAVLAAILIVSVTVPTTRAFSFTLNVPYYGPPGSGVCDPGGTNGVLRTGATYHLTWSTEGGTDATFLVEDLGGRVLYEARGTGGSGSFQTGSLSPEVCAADSQADTVQVHGTWSAPLI
ncbi:MAG: hypothetical protein KGJ23_04795 [Euryarchaeota archaeon]|nr:hypothetical protein [Euryarchaeota archaeon]MDE1835916.1 hypothetical protein [Euryarchaeota archaeon]MDE1880209.1 hypothetical protein [Euryarchaeota archaeon]MDE2044406.1 hypothetical protein [Thermoplasmata archaeon]